MCQIVKFFYLLTINTNVRNGITTTEFWVTVFVLIIAGTVATIAFYQGTKTSDVFGSLALLIAFVKAHGYDIGRVKCKLEELFNHQQPAPPCPVPPPCDDIPRMDPAALFVLKNSSIFVRADKSKTILTIEIEKEEKHRKEKIPRPPLPPVLIAANKNSLITP